MYLSADKFQSEIRHFYITSEKLIFILQNYFRRFTKFKNNYTDKCKENKNKMISPQFIKFNTYLIVQLSDLLQFFISKLTPYTLGWANFSFLFRNMKGAKGK